MPTLPIDRLVPHPDNANRMNDALLRTLAGHIGRTGRYPPIIVRPHPTQSDRYQILDGHHRVRVLEQLGRTDANCQVWDVDDDEAVLLLLTLNRLEGVDDPQRRGALLEHLHRSLDLPSIAELVPEDEDRISRLIELTRPAPRPAPPVDAADMPQAVTFFLVERQKQALESKLRQVDRDRSRALVALLNLGATTDEAPTHA